MQITIDTSAGFCWGVVRAIDYTERALLSDSAVYSLGDIIHNASEIERLGRKGLKTISTEDFPNLKPGTKVIIRAHGEPPATYNQAQEHSIELVDATCPIVTKVQERVRKFYDQNYQVVIFGKKDHAEVIGIRGVTDNTALVVLTVEEAVEKVDFSKPTVLFSQTTMDKETFYAIRDALRSKIERLEIGTIEETASAFHAKDTICGQVSGREKKLQEFARRNDVVIFTAGKNSSNGKVLFHIAFDANPRTYFVETTDEIQWEWFQDAESIGISGATSTPQWAMQHMKEAIQNYFIKNPTALSSVQSFSGPELTPEKAVHKTLC